MAHFVQITDLYRKVIEAQQSQTAADKALDYIDNQQKELEAVIAHYESQVASFTSDSSRSMPGRIPADKEREKMSATFPLRLRPSDL